jgi:hypothetical protein
MDASRTREFSLSCPARKAFHSLPFLFFFLLFPL